LNIWCSVPHLPLADFAKELKSLRTIEVGGKSKRVIMDELRKGFPGVRIQQSNE
jgi:hypothetical protein